MDRRGFTLLELLISVAIVAVLAATLTPSLLSIRKRTADLAAKAYLKQVIQWIASADTGGLLGTGLGQVNLSGDDCRHPVLQSEGAPGNYPKPVQACQINFDVATKQYVVTVTAQTGNSISGTYWLY